MEETDSMLVVLWLSHSKLLHIINVSVFSLYIHEIKMPSKRVVLEFALFALIMFAFTLDSSQAAYRKPPFNGSIFGKRANTGNTHLF